MKWHTPDNFVRVTVMPTVRQRGREQQRTFTSIRKGTAVWTATISVSHADAQYRFMEEIAGETLPCTLAEFRAAVEEAAAVSLLMTL